MEEFIAASPNSKEILNSAKLLQAVNIHALIYGDIGVGKKTLAKFISPEARVFSCHELQKDIIDKVINIEKQTIIIKKVEEITNIDLILNWVEKNEIRVIATTQAKTLNSKLNDIFSITLSIPPLSKREEDLKLLTQKFSNEASKVLRTEKILPSKLMLNTSKNAHSLRKSIYFSYLFETVGEDEILMFLENFMLTNLEGENSYKDFVYLFEVPLLKAAKKKYKSQVQMAKHLGLNRITLRKKLEIHKELL
ncbi:Fis family transcriptional regulator [Malaciobacter halophilus]|uniref:Fis family transcriptional regulator n=1 Tax=Malaciobacter halophilus TaxID=197482 RepID=A0A2N1J5D7_9BACT|nr:Fis family transcriptional regulator [Malaciobacter halophilus]AXH10768.1 hypothetical protein AHALO_2438 [Malaciobacter halophilus]PKI81787.1 Fis family transcriptional regulator [Malaciobacter halophilus]